MQQRLDQFIVHEYKNYSRNYIHYLFSEKQIKKNHKIVKKNALVKKGDQIDITFIALPVVKLTAEDIPLDILFEDDDIIICNKPSSMVTHPAPGSLKNTFAGALLFYLKSLPKSDDDLRPGIVHRLDKDTSGVIVAAKNAKSLKAMQELFAQRKVHKQYVFICHNTLASQEVNANIKRHKVKRKLMTVDPEGKEALTRFSLIESSKGYSLVRAFPHTGRTHQIRVHAKYLNCPIVGDPLYGPKKNMEKRLMLHAENISFIHPFTKNPISITAPIPNEMSFFMDSCK